MHYRAIAQLQIGRRLRRNEVVHHIDGNHSNDDPKNLRVMTVRAHLRLHAKQRYAARVAAGQAPARPTVWVSVRFTAAAGRRMRETLRMVSQQQGRRVTFGEAMIAMGNKWMAEQRAKQAA